MVYFDYSPPDEYAAITHQDAFRVLYRAALKQ